ncbi:MAG: methyltransferase domain-containing protein [Bacteroidetes bacterium]|nr:methyltransferase domain-containing protein [Bacteroidota bacterium]
MPPSDHWGDLLLSFHELSEENAYILGTEQNELYRLGLQHQVWATEAQEGWRRAGFTAGQFILDLGSGPGYCARELAFVCGNSGKVIAVDKSQSYLSFLEDSTQSLGLSIETQCADFDAMTLEEETLDGMYSRWALAWVPNPKEVLSKVKKALRPGGRMVLHEYYDWSTHQTEPPLEGLKEAISAALKSFKDTEGEIDIGRELPQIFDELGMEVISVRLMTKIGRPNDLVWQWPKSFYKSYFPRLMDMGYLNSAQVDEAFSDLAQLETMAGATLFGPTMVEVIVEKP